MSPRSRLAAATRLGAILLLPMLAGCVDNPDSLTGVNEANIAAEVANPADLIQGREPTGGADGQLAAAAVHRLRMNKVKPLPDSAITDFQVQQAPGSNPPAGGS